MGTMGFVSEAVVLFYVIIYLLLTQLLTNWCCHLTLAYAFWFVYDKDTSSRGGRPIRWIRRLNFIRKMAEYYPVTFEKTKDLDPNEKYLFGYHPHGASAGGAAMIFATDVLDTSKAFPGIQFHLLSHKVLHNIPVVRELLAVFGIGDVSRQSIDYVLQDAGHAAVIVVGGAREALMTDLEKTYIVLKNRKGFIRLAIKHGANLVPVFSFGETALLKVHCRIFPETKLNLVQKIIKWFLSYPPLIVSGSGFFHVPFRVPVHAIVGKPICVEKDDNPSEGKIDEIHEIYMRDLEALYEDNKARFGVDVGNRLIFV